MTWHCIRTATRQEHKVVEALKDLARERHLTIDVYLPCETRWNHLTRVKTIKHVPMLPGYLFARVPAAQLWRVDRLDGVYQILGWNDVKVEREVKGLDAFVSELRDAEHAGLFDRTQAPANKRLKLNKGERVRVSGGQFSGFVGEIIEKRGSDRVRVLLTLFGRASPVTFPIKQLELQDAGSSEAA